MNEGEREARAFVPSVFSATIAEAPGDPFVPGFQVTGVEFQTDAEVMGWRATGANGELGPWHRCVSRPSDSTRFVTEAADIRRKLNLPGGQH